MIVSNKNTKKRTVIKTIAFLLAFIAIVGGFMIVFSILVANEQTEFYGEQGTAVSGPATAGQTETK